MDDLSSFCCQNLNCPDYGKRGGKNLSVCDRYGPNSNSRWQAASRRQECHFPSRVLADKFPVQIANHHGENRQLAQVEST